MGNDLIQTVERDGLRLDPVQSAELESPVPSTCDLKSRLATVWHKCGPVATEVGARRGRLVAGGWLVDVWALLGFRSATIWTCFTRFLPLTADSRKTKATGTGNNNGFSDVPQWDIRALGNFMLS